MKAIETVPEPRRTQDYSLTVYLPPILLHSLPVICKACLMVFKPLIASRSLITTTWIVKSNAESAPEDLRSKNRLLFKIGAHILNYDKTIINIKCSHTQAEKQAIKFRSWLKNLDNSLNFSSSSEITTETMVYLFVQSLNQKNVCKSNNWIFSLEHGGHSDGRRPTWNRSYAQLK